MSLTLTLVRHGESTDNLKSLWAGHRDAPLTTHGMNQARRLGKSFSSIQISKIYASDLKRAHWTALQIATQNNSLLSALSGSSPSSSSLQSGIQAPEDGTSGGRGSTLASEGANDLEGETEEEVAETEPGPSSFLSTDRQGAASFDPMSGGDAPPPPPAASTSSSGSYATAVGSSTTAEYEDDFSCSSSAAASSPVRSSSSSARPVRTSTSSNPSSSSAIPSTSTNIPSSSSSIHSSEEQLAQTVTTTPLLREQFFGLAEGQNWKTGYATSSSSFHNRAYRFEGGESLEDVHRRAEEIMQRCVVPWLVRATKEGRKEHVVLVAHGIMISELLYALSRLQDPRAMYERRSGHTNTGWTRLTLSFPSNITQNPSGLQGHPIPGLKDPDLPSRYGSTTSSNNSAHSITPAGGSETAAAANPSLPKISIRQTHTNITTHLDGLKRTKGGVGSQSYDARQKNLKQFFSGNNVSTGASSSSSASASAASASATSSAATPSVKKKSGKGGETVDLTGSDTEQEAEGEEQGEKEKDTDGLEDAYDTAIKKTNGEINKRGIRVHSPLSPSPKKGRMT